MDKFVSAKFARSLMRRYGDQVIGTDRINEVIKGAAVNGRNECKVPYDLSEEIINQLEDLDYDVYTDWRGDTFIHWGEF